MRRYEGHNCEQNPRAFLRCKSRCKIASDWFNIKANIRNIQGMQKCAFCYTKSRPRVSKKHKECIILMILFTKFRTDNLDYMRRGSNVVLRKKNHAKQ